MFTIKNRWIALLSLILQLILLCHKTFAAKDICEVVPGSEFARPGRAQEVLPYARQLMASISSKVAVDYILKRWDGVDGTAYDHAEWMLARAREFTDSKYPGFRHHGSHEGIDFEIHDELTSKMDGDGFFRLSGSIDIPPALLVAMVMDADSLGSLDATVMYTNFYHRYPDGRTYLCIWTAAPGFPFHWRDGLDISSWKRDEDGTYWQYALSVPTEMIQVADTAMRAIDRYWAYKLEPLDGGKRTKLTLICQASLFGYIPKMAVNWQIGNVLADYVRTVESVGLDLIRTGMDKALLDRIIR